MSSDKFVANAESVFNIYSILFTIFFALNGDMISCAIDILWWSIYVLFYLIISTNCRNVYIFIFSFAVTIFRSCVLEGGAIVMVFWKLSVLQMILYNHFFEYEIPPLSSRGKHNVVAANFNTGLFEIKDQFLFVLRAHYLRYILS